MHSSAMPSGPADLVFDNAALFPLSLETQVPMGLAIAGGRIAYAGPRDGLAPWIGPNTRKIDLGSKWILPGFVDAHLHPLMGGLALLECDVSGRLSLDDVLSGVRTYAAAHPDLPFIRGGGWTLGVFPGERPSRQLLDAAIDDRPAFLKAMDGHSLWANTAALRAAGIHAHTPQPPGGAIEKDPATGEPTGWFKEWTAMALVEKHFPPPSHEQRLQGARAFMAKAAAAGVVSVSDAMLTDADWQVYSELDRRGQLSVRVHGMILRTPHGGDEERQRILDLLRHPPTDRLRAFAVKLFLDGVVEAHTAWLNEPYADQPDNRGTLIWPEDEFRREVAWWDAQGACVHVHAIGDAAVKLAVDAMEDAARANGPRDRRHQIAHADMVRPEEIQRMARLGILAVVQPAWSYVDHAFFDNTLPALGRPRAFAMYPFRQMLDAGVRMACGSDWPFGGDSASLSPLEAIQVGATRLGLANDYPTVYLPEQRLPLPALFHAYSANGAYAQFRERDFGALRPGRLADLVVLDRNPFAVDPSQIHAIPIRLTLLDGRPTYPPDGEPYSEFRIQDSE
jgi:predicted amidohydrolase YtcJ